MTQDAVFDKSTAYTVKDAITAALFARDAGTAGTTNSERGQTQPPPPPPRDGQCIEISLLEAGMQFFWPHAMKGYTFYDSENDMQHNIYGADAPHQSSTEYKIYSRST